MKYPILIISILVTFWGCKPEEEKLTFGGGADLRFSADTVFFDTLFTSVGSITKRFNVFNDNDNAVEIKNISLKKASSAYTVYVNGRASNQFANVRLLGKDSLLILVEITIDPENENLPFIVTDEITFNTNDNLQNVKLVAWGQDANFLRDSVLTCNETWTAERPYVLYNSVLVDSLCTLTVEPGAKIYSHNGSYIFIKGSIRAEGAAENRILFRNDRLDFEHVPGQWGGIIFLPGSNENRILYADIRNAEVGIYLGTPDEDNTPDLIVGNSRIENIGGVAEIPVTGGLVLPGYGILAITSDMYAYNTLVDNCAINTVGNYAGGNYRYEHCTFANYSFDFFRKDPSVVFSDNLVIGENDLLVEDIDVQLFNSIIWGNLNNEIQISNGGEANFSLTMGNNLLRTTNIEFEINKNILNIDPKFKDPRGYDYHLDTLSAAKDAGEDLGVLLDLDGEPREGQPDLGAFERIEN